MINNIKQVASFAHKDKSNIFSNVLIKDGYMTAQNGLTGISISVDSDIDFCCNAVRLNQVLNNCEDKKLKLKLTDKNIGISSGSFKSRVQTINPDMYHVQHSESEIHGVQSDILNEMNSIAQFTDPNDVRLALQGVAITSDSIKATNGHVAIKKEIEHIDIDDAIIPTKSIQLMAKLNKSIISISVSNNTVFFNFDGGFLFTKTIDQKMPDIDRILSEIENSIDLQELKDPLTKISMLCDDTRVVKIGSEIKTRNDDASFNGFDFPESAFNVDYILKIIDIAGKIDISKYPNSCPFEGDKITGAIMGIRI